MTAYEQQQAEKETIRPRSITLELSDPDCERLLIKAETKGLSVEKLLEKFIADLVDGTSSNGSNERTAANEWLDIFCYKYEYMLEKTLLRHILNKNYGDIRVIDDIKSLVKYYDECVELEAKVYDAENKASTDDFVDEDYADLHKDLANCESLLVGYFEGYAETSDNKITIGDEVEICRKWLGDIQKLKGIER